MNVNEAAEPNGFVDWALAERLGVALAGSAAGTPPISQAELDRAAGPAAALVLEYTGLEPVGDLPRSEVVSRPEWVRANLAALRDASGELERRLAGSLRIPGPLGPGARALAGAAAGAEAGLTLGYLARKVLGQYDVALIGPARAPRLLFIAPNLAEAHGRTGGSRERLLRWVALHEATHAAQFGAVPWLREHLGGMVQELIGGAPVRIELRELRLAAQRLLSKPDARRLAAQLRDNGLVALLAGPGKADILRRLQAAMAVIEGYSEHVMDAIGAELDPGYARLRSVLEAERERRGRLDAIVARLLGLDWKLRQYALGKRFADSVASHAGIEGLNAVWRGPEALPTLAELERPEPWLERVL